MTKAFQIFITVIGQTLILLSLSSHSLSQLPNKITYGDLDTNRISVEEFIKQKQLKSSDGLLIDSAFVYFSIPGQNAIAMVDYLPKFDSVRFQRYSGSLVPGAVVIFKVFVTDNIHKSYPVQLSYIFYALTKGNLISSSPKYLEWKKLRDLNYLSGTIYFAGTYFPNVIVFQIQKGNTDELRRLFERCAIGTVITFDNVSYKDEHGNLFTRNDNFTL